MALRKNEKSEKLAPSDKRRIADLILAERLGLEWDWIYPDFIVHLPEEFPPKAGPKLNREDVKDIEVSIAKLVKLGCNRKVLNWCLQQLGAEANSQREGKKTITILNEDEERNEERLINTPLATREDIAGLINKVDGAQNAIRKHRNELLLVADACADSHPLPGGMLSDPAPIAAESMLVLLDSLSWVKRLAASWHAPNVASMVKSKGILFLLVYVWIHSQKPHAQGAGKRQKGRGGKRSPYRLEHQVVEEIVQLNFVLTRMDHSAEDLNDKLQDFRKDQPALFKKLMTRLEVLDQQATSASK